MKINLRLLHIYLAKIYPRYNLASIIKFLVHRAHPLDPPMYGVRSIWFRPFVFRPSVAHRSVRCCVQQFLHSLNIILDLDIFIESKHWRL